MRPMKISPECRACLERLVDLTVDLATEDPGLRGRAAAAAREIIAQEFPKPGAIPALIASRFHLAIQEITGTPDPFAARKAAATALLARMHRRLTPGYGDDLESLLKLAALGNAVDFSAARLKSPGNSCPRRGWGFGTCPSFAGPLRPPKV